MSLYRDIILDHYRNPRNYGKLSTPTKTIKLNNPLCGDEINIEIAIEKNKVEDIAFESSGCIISKASTSLLCDFARSKSMKELNDFNKKDMIELVGIELGPNRLKCALLPLEALHKIV